MDAFQTEYDFVLPLGYIDDSGTMHREGKMRLATAADEILPMRDPRVQQNPSYMTIILLSRVITRLGTLKMVSNKVVENLYTKDFSFLQEMYNRINQQGMDAIPTTCPKCEHKFNVDVQLSGE